ncbi:hypothetical protein HII31_09470 [Pseudocercospora fuligena]|uniref:Uncharacterized protein n=1 Tax=Pseudocercospora fuligena TaxID=685502 RepID=A0A8H6RDG2_9PEZI|nr:hypothetical protein HII31_09470 [Pseudocercospora fuligena]
MSDQHNLPVSTQLRPTGRGQRVKKPSPKVRDAASSASNLSSPSTRLQQRKISQTVPASVSSADTAGDASQKVLTSMSSADTTVEASAASSLSSTPRTEQKIHSHPSRHSSNKTPASATTTAKAPKKARPSVMAPPKQPKRQELPPRTAPFSAATLVIYTWPPPHPPRSFLNLSESNRRWKNRKDEAEQMTDFDDGADDWEGYDGDADLYGGPEGLVSAIASTFVKRAKRAFWKGHSWADFEAAELSFDLKEAVEATDDELERRFREFEPLSNDLRLGVFDQIKERLCNEIWLEQYVPSRPSLANANNIRRDSRATT